MANVVQARILHIHDLHAADAAYHHKARSVNFSTIVVIVHARGSAIIKKCIHLSMQ